MTAERLKFPDEPIRVPSDRVPFSAWENDDYDPDACCMTCDGDGYVSCDGGVDCPEADDAGCPFVDAHGYVCNNCGGTGDAKDQRFW